MQLRDVIKKIRQEKNWTQVQMAAELKVSQQNIQGMENAGSNLEKQWAIFLKILPYCLALDLITERELLPKKRHDPEPNQLHHKAGKAKADSR